MPHAIRAVSLDLDDTLWDTWPVLLRAEERLRAWLERHYPRIPAAWTAARMRELRVALAREQPERAHDMTWLRTESLRRCARDAGYGADVADAAFAVFHAARNEIEPYPDVRPALARLAASRRVYALSNGNACVHRVGIGGWFSAAIGAEQAGAAKPDARIYAHLVAVAGVAPHEILHVGDDPHADVDGARRAGLRTAWLDRAGREWPAELPRAELEVRCLGELAERLEALDPAAVVRH